MKEITLSVRCTREEYMAFAAARKKPSAWPIAVGAVLCALGAASVFLERMQLQTPMLLIFVGVLLMLLEPLILPFYRKGRAARQYDASDFLKYAVSLVLNEQELRVTSSEIEGTLPLSALTDTVVTSGTIALCFGRELTVCIPVRALSEEERVTMKEILKIS